MHDSASRPATNPLLIDHGLPRFDAIQTEHVVPGMRALLASVETELAQFEARLDASAGRLTWETLLDPIEILGDRIALAWGTVSHLMSVKNSDALRDAYQTMQPEVVKFRIRIGQSAAIYRGLLELRDGPAWQSLDEGQRRVVKFMIQDAELTGIGLTGAARERFNAIQTEQAELRTTYSNNLLDATKAFHLTLTEQSDVRGLPRSLLELAAQMARAAGDATATADAGPWRFTLDAPSFGPFMEHCAQRALREKMLRASMRRASDSEFDNSAIVARILALRHEEAQLLGFATYAEQSLSTKMAASVTAVDRLTLELRNACFAAAERDLAELRALARARSAPEADELRQWDIAYWAERLREQQFDYTDEELRPYFSMPRVLDGMFRVAERLFGVTVRSADGEAPVWHPDARFYKVHDEQGRHIASFYLDPYSRPEEKRGGAWMDDCLGRTSLPLKRGRPMQLPVAYLVCNGTPPVGDQPSLMTFDEVLTVFHEFGHGLQHMLTTVDLGLAAGIRNVEWDAVELASQFMENWCYHRPMLQELASHYQTGAPLPRALEQKLIAARNFRAGSHMLRQLYIGALDMELHHRYQPNGDESPFDVQERVYRQYAVLDPLPDDRFLCNLSHVFAGPYAAGYYSYKWAEVLSADAFAAFEEAGLDQPHALVATGRRFRSTVLSLGGSRHPMEVFKSFRGREPSTAALLRHSGLAR